MSVTLRTLNANDTLANHQATLRQDEELSYVVVSLSIGKASGRRANLVTLSEGGETPPTTAISLKMIDGNLDQAAQEARINEGGKQIVCYGSLYVLGELCNVLAYRDSS